MSSRSVVGGGGRVEDFKLLNDVKMYTHVCVVVCLWIIGYVELLF